MPAVIQMRATHKVSLASVVGYVATVAAVLAVPLVLVPEASRSGQFWFRVGWAEFLVTIYWAYIAGVVGADASPDKRGRGGMLYSVGVTAVTFAVFSGLLLLVSVFLPDASLLSRLHWASQIVLAAIAVVACVFVYYSRVAADTTSPS